MESERFRLLKSWWWKLRGYFDTERSLCVQCDLKIKRVPELKPGVVRKNVHFKIIAKKKWKFESWRVVLNEKRFLLNSIIFTLLMKCRGKITLNGTIAIFARKLGALNKLKGKQYITTRKQICLKDTTCSRILSLNLLILFNNFYDFPLLNTFCNI